MKLSVKQLRKLIKEEVASLKEMHDDPLGGYYEDVSAAHDAAKTLQSVLRSMTEHERAGSGPFSGPAQQPTWHNAQVKIDELVKQLTSHLRWLESNFDIDGPIDDVTPEGGRIPARDAGVAFDLDEPSKGRR